ncbi:MAG: ATP-grasp domain-containing protein [Planctomycetales bacterium]|nr:ATP-grasp domain-containing protein [Planctomycetales bacterium]
MSAFVTDGFWRKSVAAVRALGRAGIRAHAGESTWLAPALWSRHAAGRCVYPSPRTDPDAFLARLRRECAARRVRVLLPMEEETLALLLSRPGEVPRGVALPAGPREAFEEARDKRRATARAASLGIRTPWTRAPGSPAEAAAAVAEAPLPAVVKPRVGSGARGLRYAATREELRAAWREVAARGPALIQERIPGGPAPAGGGAGIGVSVLLDAHGGVRALFCHRRLREYPVSGGAATLAESVAVREAGDLVEAAVSLCRSLGLVGVAMVEFRRDPRGGAPLFLEVNPRFWGSLALAVEAGVNFPALLYRTALGEQTGPPPEYAAGVRCRFLFPGDLLHFLRNPDRLRLDPPFFRLGARGLPWDLWARDDPAPAAGQFGALLPLLFRREWRRYLGATA